ncbi:hypothetical protein [Fictibacillus sp. BK138]|uniref:hypothetical protein n=1 Tax=Fictibacillus sp. BK138 TaxID=2512121 RepID=UPI001028C888|nr:hypothetical protein [Fictibacillus sp. BK138]RZT23634.1 hypothetical protein EV282_2729 [Fictibacillus sp. BK138]
MKKVVVFVITLLLLLSLLTGCESERKNETKYIKARDRAIEYVEKNHDWDLSPTFKYETEDNGVGVTYNVLGKKDSFGITGPFPIVAGVKQKYFWFYWGEDQIKDQPVEIMAYKKGSNELIKLFSGEFYEGAQISENEVNMPSNLKFPSAGVWNVLIYINDQLSGNIVVKVVPKG